MQNKRDEFAFLIYDRQKSYLLEMPEIVRQEHNMVACGIDTLMRPTIFYPTPSQLENKINNRPHTNLTRNLCTKVNSRL